MKLFSLILSVYIFCLAVMPCSDIHLVLEESKQAIAHHDDHTTHDHDQDTEKHCSPFCTCTCCHTPINFEFGIKNFVPDILYVEISTDEITFLYYDSPSTAYRNTIWQPPKVNA
jgi:hypothetical protein